MKPRQAMPLEEKRYMMNVAKENGNMPTFATVLKMMGDQKFGKYLDIKFPETDDDTRKRRVRDMLKKNWDKF